MNKQTPVGMSAQPLASYETLNETRVWQIFARTKYEEPLHEIGNVVADDVELARVYARSIYDEFGWIEMVMVPRDAIVTVIAP